jgi:hypothetical protein
MRVLAHGIVEQLDELEDRGTGLRTCSVRSCNVCSFFSVEKKLSATALS